MCQLFFFSGVINSDNFFSRLFGNTFWLIAFIYYIYITFLGYNCECFYIFTCDYLLLIDFFDSVSGIPFLKNTRIILAPIPIIILLYVITLIIGWNITMSFVDFYHYRVLWDGTSFPIKYELITALTINLVLFIYIKMSIKILVILWIFIYIISCFVHTIWMPYR